MTDTDLNEVAGPAEAPTQQPAPPVCVTINKVENGYLVNVRDRHYSNNKDYIYQTIDEVIDHIRITFE